MIRFFVIITSVVLTKVQGSMKSVELRARARELRKQGYSLGDIAAEVGAAKATVSLWVRDIELDEIQLDMIGQKRSQKLRMQNKGAQANRHKFRTIRQAYQEAGRLRARETPTLLHAMGCMLYWAEGAKTRTEIAFVNSDPEMMVLFCRFLKEELNVTDDLLVLQVTSHSRDPEVNRAQNEYWLKLLNLPESCLRKTVHKEGNPVARHRVLTNGICRLAVHRSEYLQHIFGAIQEYIGIDKPEWLG